MEENNLQRYQSMDSILISSLNDNTEQYDTINNHLYSQQQQQEEKEEKEEDEEEEETISYFSDLSSNLIDLSANNIDIFNNNLRNKDNQITYKKYTYKEVENDILNDYFSEKEYHSCALDILATYLKGQKLIYMESKNYCENNLNSLMMPAILLSTTAIQHNKIKINKKMTFSTYK